jgi:hypothetical protein
VGRSLWRDDGFIVYNCCWALPAQGFISIFYCLTFATAISWRDRPPYLLSPGIGWPSHNPRHWDPYSPPLTTGKATVEFFEKLVVQVKIKAMLWPTMSRPVCFDLGHPSGTRGQLFFLFFLNYLYTVADFFMWAPSLTTGRVCNLQLLLGLANTCPSLVRLPRQS